MFGKESTGDKNINQNKNLTTIGAFTKIDGSFSSDSDTRIDGQVDGEIDINGLLRVGETSRIKGNIKTEEIIVEGKIEGNIEAVGDVKIMKSGRINGDIILGGDLVIEPGAIFIGSSRMQEKSANEDLMSDDIDLKDDLKDPDLDFE